MNTWVFFRRARIALFSFLVLICLTWTILIAVLLSHEWSHFSPFQKIIVVSLLSLYGSTAILLYLMVVVHFCLWWDVARVFGLLVVHAGSCVLFTLYRSSFPCRGFDTETMCREFVYTIFIGCWVFSGIILCFAIALGVMAFIPRPVEFLPETEEDDTPLTPASFKAGSPSDEHHTISFYSIDSRTGLVTYNNRGELSEASLSPDWDSSPVNGAHRETITMEPPRLWWQNFQRPNLRHSNDTTYGGVMSTRNAPKEGASVVSGLQRVDSVYRNPFSDPSPPLVPTSRASKIRPGVGESSSIAEDRPNMSSAFSELKHDVLSPVSLPNSPLHVTTPRDRATEYTPTLYSTRSHYSVRASSGDHSLREQTYPDSARTATPRVRSFHSSTASVHSMWVESPLVLPPLVLTPDVARFRGISSLLGPKISPSGSNASFAARGPIAPLSLKVSEPSRTVQHHGELSGHQPYISPIQETPFVRRGSDGQVLDQTQWWRLVLNAAAKP